MSMAAKSTMKVLVLTSCRIETTEGSSLLTVLHISFTVIKFNVTISRLVRNCMGLGIMLLGTEPSVIAMIENFLAC